MRFHGRFSSKYLLCIEQILYIKKGRNLSLLGMVVYHKRSKSLCLEWLCHKRFKSLFDLEWLCITKGLNLSLLGMVVYHKRSESLFAWSGCLSQKVWISLCLEWLCITKGSNLLLLGVVMSQKVQISFCLKWLCHKRSKFIFLWMAMYGKRSNIFALSSCKWQQSIYMSLFRQISLYFSLQCLNSYLP